MSLPVTTKNNYPFDVGDGAIVGMANKVITRPGDFDGDDDDLRSSVDQAIGNTETLLPMVKELQEKVAALEKKVSDLEADAERRDN